MLPDPEGQNRAKLSEAAFVFQDRVDTPWESAPDLPVYNGALYKRMARFLKQMERQCQSGGTVPSRGVLLQGEAGMGKTHLLMRLTQSFADTHHMIFIRKPNNEDAVARHVWSNILESLTRPTPSAPRPGWSQFDAMLSHVLTKVLLLELNNDLEKGKGSSTTRQWITLLQQTPDNLYLTLQQSSDRTRDSLFLQRKAMDYFSLHHSNLELNVVEGLLRYHFLEDQQQKRHLLHWLQGQDLASEDAEALGVPESWIEIAPEATKAGILNAKEDKALRAIRSIGILSTYYHPLLVAFDQLEGLRDDRILTRRWGDIMREIFTMTPNMLVLTCIFPSLWDTWFQEELDDSTTDRIAEYEFSLETLNENHAMAMLTAHLAVLNAELGLPAAPYPFAEDDITALFRPGMTPRRFLRKARQTLEDWLDEEDAYGPSSTPASEISSPATQMLPPVVSAPPVVPVPVPEDPEEPVGPAELPQTPDLLQPPAEPKPEEVKPALERRSAVARLLSRRLPVLQQQHQEQFNITLPNEEDLFGRIKDFTLFFVEQRKAPIIMKKHDSTRVLPDAHFLLYLKHLKDEEKGYICCVAVSHHNGAALTSRIRNMSRSFSDILFVRDGRCQQPGRTARKLLDDLGSENGSYLPLKFIDYHQFYAICDLLTEVQEKRFDLEEEGHVTQADLFEFLEREEHLFRSKVLHALFERIEESVAAFSAEV